MQRPPPFLFFLLSSKILYFLDELVLILFDFFNFVSWMQKTDGSSSHNNFSNESSLLIKPAAFTPIIFNYLEFTLLCFLSFLLFCLPLFLLIIPGSFFSYSDSILSFPLVSLDFLQSLGLSLAGVECLSLLESHSPFFLTMEVSLLVLDEKPCYSLWMDENSYKLIAYKFHHSLYYDKLWRGFFCFVLKPLHSDLLDGKRCSEVCRSKIVYESRVLVHYQEQLNDHIRKSRKEENTDQNHS